MKTMNHGMVMAALTIGLIGSVEAAKLNGPTIAGVPFATYGTGYRTKIDFAALDHDLPIPHAALQKLRPVDVGAMDAEQFDQLYARLSSGPIPDGGFDGTVYLSKGGGLRMMSTYISPEAAPPWARKFVAWAVKKSVDDEGLKKFFELLWKGKRFNRAESTLRNLVPGKLSPFLAFMGAGPKELLNFNGQSEAIPAKVYCGQSLLDSRRESIVMDYLFNADVPGYREIPDSIAGAQGFAIRDEIRMVRPGFYIGKAYSNRVHLLNFALYNPTMAEGPLAIQTVQDECDSGYQERPSSLALASEDFFVRK